MNPIPLKDKLIGFGFSDEDIDEINAVPLHRFLVKMNVVFGEVQKADMSSMLDDFKGYQNRENDRFHEKLISDVTNVIGQELVPIKEDITALKGEIENIKKAVRILEDNYDAIIRQHRMNHTKVMG